MKIGMIMTDKKVIEIKVTSAHIEEMRSDGVSEAEIPPLGTVKRYRPARHILHDKVAILLDTDIVEHFKKRSESGDQTFYQTEINRTLRNAIEGKK